jgi:hypothetical protein
MRLCSVRSVQRCLPMSRGPGWCWLAFGSMFGVDVWIIGLGNGTCAMERVINLLLGCCNKDAAVLADRDLASDCLQYALSKPSK